MKEQHVGSDFDEHLEEEGLLEETEAVAAKRVFAYQVAQAMEEQGLSKSAMADHMGTSRSSLDRLLDPEVPSVTLATLQKAARALGKKVKVEMVDSPPERESQTPEEVWKRMLRYAGHYQTRYEHALYARKENPVHALYAYRVARLTDIEVPEWVWAVFDKWAEAVYRQQPTEAKEIAHTMGLGTTSGRSKVTQAQTASRDLGIVQRIFQLRSDQELSKMDIFYKIEEEFANIHPDLKGERAQDIWYEWAKELGIP